VSLHADVRVRRGTLDLDVTLEVGAGETVVLLGPNGAGKTTLLSVLAGLVGLDEGRISLDDLVLDDPQSGEWVPTERRRIGYVFQDQLLFPHLSAVDNDAQERRLRRIHDPSLSNVCSGEGGLGRRVTPGTAEVPG
jgi:molybdate transport system ATP-binding protein